MPIVSMLEYIGVVAFALSGALTAVEEKLDVFGVYMLALVTAVGGGITRDVVMDIGVPAFFSSYTTIALVILAATAVILTRGRIRWRWLMTVCDSIGLAFFITDAGIKAIGHGYNFPQFIFMSVITGVGGGVLRDIMCRRVPMILKSEVYATAGIAGACILWVGYKYTDTVIIEYITIAVIIAIRLICVKFNINLPKVKSEINR